MSGRDHRARKVLVGSTALALALVHAGACGSLDTVYLGKWLNGAAGAGGEGGEASSGTSGHAGAPSSGGEGGRRGESVLPVDAELWDGAVRLVSASTRLTVGSDGTTLSLAPFRGESEQMWLLEAEGQSVRFVHDQTSTCLTEPLSLSPCAEAPAFRVFLLRERTEERPSLYEVESEQGECLNAAAAGLTWGACGVQNAGFHLEPSGWGRRAGRPAELEVHMALIVKALGSTAGGMVALDIEADHVAAVRHSFDECVRIWLAALTDGRVSYTSEAFTSPRPLEQVETICDHAVPAMADLSADLTELVPAKGAFDGVVVYWRPDSGVDGGWSCSGLGGPHGEGLGYQAYGYDAASWLSCTTDPSSAFIQAYMAMAAPFYADRGVPAPEGGLDGATAQYAAGAFNWNHFRRDYLLGRVIRADGAYGGLGPRAFRLGSIRAPATP